MIRGVCELRDVTKEHHTVIPLVDLEARIIKDQIDQVIACAAAEIMISHHPDRPIKRVVNLNKLWGCQQKDQMDFVCVSIQRVPDAQQPRNISGAH